MKNAPSGIGPKVPLPKNNDDDYEVVWHGGLVSPSGQKGQLLPDTHNVGSTWDASVERIRRRIDVINKRDLDA